MTSPVIKDYTTANMLQNRLNDVFSSLDDLRRDMADFYEERGITGFDIRGMSATDLIKHVRIVVLTCSTPEKKAQ